MERVTVAADLPLPFIQSTYSATESFCTLRSSVG